MEEELRANARVMEEMKSFQERLQETKSKAAAEKEEALKKKNDPHLTNLNEDPMLTAKVTYFVNKGKIVLPVLAFKCSQIFNYLENVYVGKKSGKPQPDITLGGVGIQPNHAVFHFVDGSVYLEPCNVIYNSSHIVVLNFLPIL